VEGSNERSVSLVFGVSLFQKPIISFLCFVRLLLGLIKKTCPISCGLGAWDDEGKVNVYKDVWKSASGFMHHSRPWLLSMQNENTGKCIYP
jgi:hypothetical protein